MPQAAGSSTQTQRYEEDPLLLNDYSRTPRPDDEGEPEYAAALNNYMDNALRLGFIRKVYGILCVQICVTILIALPFHLFQALNDFVIMNPSLIYVTLGMAMIFVFILTCCPDVAQKYPNNYVLLFGFTIAESLLLGVITAQHDTFDVILAVGVTCGIFLVLTCYAFWTDADFTGYGIYLLVAMLVMIGIGLVGIIFQIPFIRTIYHTIGVMIFCFYIVYDTQLIVGGKHHQYSFAIDDYVLAALCLYLDIINLFLHILSLLSGDK